MRIGEFAKLCDTKISVLRHYDKEGVLLPNYVDSMTGYRYYSKEQVQNFQRIKVLSRAGFSLKEIREVLPQIDDIAFLQRKIEEKKEELNKVFSNLEKAKELLLYNQHEEEYQIQEIEGRKICKIPILMPMVNEKFSEVCQQLQLCMRKIAFLRVLNFCRKESVSAYMAMK